MSTKMILNCEDVRNVDTKSRVFVSVELWRVVMVKKLLKAFNKHKFTLEQNAINWLQSQGYEVNSYSGSNGITFHRVGCDNITIWRTDRGIWTAFSE